MSRPKKTLIIIALLMCFVFPITTFASTHPMVPYEAILTNVSTDNNTTSTSSFPQVNGNMYHPSFSGASNFFEDVTCLFGIRYRPDSIRGSYYHISAEFILFYADLHDKDYFANSKVTVEFCADKAFGSTTYKYTEVISPTITNPSGNDTRYSFSIDYDFQYLTNNLNLFNHCRISIEPGNPDNFEGEPGTPSDFYWIGFQRFSISEPYTPNQDIIDNQNENTQQIIDNQNQLQQNEKDEASSSGNSNVDDVIGAIPTDNEGLINALTNFAGAMMYNGTECAWTFPEVKFPKVAGITTDITLIEEQPINFKPMIDAVIPDNIMKLIKAISTVGLIIYCCKELYGWIEYIATLRKGKSGGSDE